MLVTAVGGIGALLALIHAEHSKAANNDRAFVFVDTNDSGADRHAAGLTPLAGGSVLLSDNYTDPESGVGPGRYRVLRGDVDAQTQAAMAAGLTSNSTERYVVCSKRRKRKRCEQGTR